MKKAKKYLIIPLLVVPIFLMAGCIRRSPELPQKITQEKVFDADFSTVWIAVIDVVGEFYPIQSVEKESGLLTTEFVGSSTIHAAEEIDKIAARPNIPLATWSSLRYRFNIFVRSQDGSTKVRIKPCIEGYEDNVTHSWQICKSRGVLEDKLFKKIKARLD